MWVQRVVCLCMSTYGWAITCPGSHPAFAQVILKKCRLMISLDAMEFTDLVWDIWQAADVLRVVLIPPWRRWNACWRGTRDRRCNTLLQPIYGGEITPQLVSYRLRCHPAGLLSPAFGEGAPAVSPGTAGWSCSDSSPHQSGKKMNNINTGSLFMLVHHGDFSRNPCGDTSKQKQQGVNLASCLKCCTSSRAFYSFAWHKGGHIFSTQS